MAKIHSPYLKSSVYNQDFGLTLCKLKLRGSSFSVLYYLIGKLEDNNEVLLNISEGAKELKITRNNIHNGIKQLIENKVIKKLPKKIANLNYYQINPSLLYMGDFDNYDACVSTWEK
jgi:hypothetical protein